MAALKPVGVNTVLSTSTSSAQTLSIAQQSDALRVVGDAASLTVTGQSNFDFTHKIVTDINTTSNVGGYYNTRATIDHNSIAVTDIFNAPYAELRKSIKVAVKTDSGAGKAFIQQVQDS